MFLTCTRDSDNSSIGGILKKLRYVLFGAYIFLVLWLTLIDRQFGERRAMLIPFWEYISAVRGIRGTYYIKQILGNLTLLFPLGFMLPMIRVITVKQVFVVGLCFSCFIELMQYIMGCGLMEFDDVFNNTTGAIIGYLIYKGVRRRKNKIV